MQSWPFILGAGERAANQIAAVFRWFLGTTKKSHSSCVKTRQFRATISANDRQGYRKVKYALPGGPEDSVIASAADLKFL
jgi:hypothetical protein